MAEENSQEGTSIEVGGIKFTGGKMMIAITALSTAAGGLWGAFEFYKDYMDMKEQIQNYVAPDLSGINERISIADEKMKGIEDSVIQAADYTRDIKNDLKGDIQNIEKLTVDTDRRTRQIQTDIDKSLREIEQLNRETEKDVRDTMRETEKRIEADSRQLKIDLEDQLQKALDNPLSNK